MDKAGIYDLEEIPGKNRRKKMNSRVMWEEKFGMGPEKFIYQPL